jgi:hypothetical protein
MLDQESLAHEVIEEAGEDIDLISRLEHMNLDKEETGIAYALRENDKVHLT